MVKLEWEKWLEGERFCNSSKKFGSDTEVVGRWVWRWVISGFRVIVYEVE